MIGKSFKVSVDSMIDIITNSSTEIYTFPTDNAEKQIEKIVNAVLDEAKSNLRFDDLFTVTRVPSYRAKDDFFEYLQYEHPELMESDNTINRKDAATWVADNKEKADKLFDSWLEDENKYSYNKNMAFDLEVRTKAGADTNIAEMISNVFDSQEVEN